MGLLLLIYNPPPPYNIMGLLLLITLLHTLKFDYLYQFFKGVY